MVWLPIEHSWKYIPHSCRCLIRLWSVFMLNVSRPNCLIISACNVRVQKHFRVCGMLNITTSKANRASTYVADLYNLTNRKRMPKARPWGSAISFAPHSGSLRWRVLVERTIAIAYATSSEYDVCQRKQRDRLLKGYPVPPPKTLAPWARSAKGGCLRSYLVCEIDELKENKKYLYELAFLISGYKQNATCSFY